MKKHQKKRKEIIQLIKPEDVINGSVEFSVDSNPRLMRFATVAFYSVFEQEDIVDVPVGTRVYRVLVLSRIQRGDQCFARGLIKEQRDES